MSLEHSPARQGKQSSARSVIDDPFLSQRDVAEMLGVSERTLERWRFEGIGPPFFRFSRLCRYKLSLTKKWADAQRRTSTSDKGEVAATSNDLPLTSGEVGT